MEVINKAVITIDELGFFQWEPVAYGKRHGCSNGKAGCSCEGNTKCGCNE